MFNTTESIPGCAVALQGANITNLHTFIAGNRRAVSLGEWCQKQIKKTRRPFAATPIT